MDFVLIGRLVDKHLYVMNHLDDPKGLAKVGLELMVLLPLSLKMQSVCYYKQVPLFFSSLA